MQAVFGTSEEDAYIGGDSSSDDDSGQDSGAGSRPISQEQFAVLLRAVKKQ